MKPNLLKTIAGGAVGTALMTAMIYFLAPRMLGHPRDTAALLGSRLLAHLVYGGSLGVIAGGPEAQLAERRERHV
jgi:hypothetical protein